MQKADKIIHASIILPIRPKKSILKHHSLIINKDCIIDLLPTDQAKKTYQSENTEVYSNHIIIPGFINSHTHSPMVLLRGLGDSKLLDKWLNNHIWPAERKLVSEKFISDGTKLGALEMLLNGVTCFSDHYFMPEIAAKICEEIGIRALVGLPMIDNILNLKQPLISPVDIIRNNDDLINFAYIPHSPYMVSDEIFKQIVKDCEANPAPIHIHLCETANEIANSIKEYGIKPIERLNNLGVFDQHVIAVHMVHCDEEDLRMISEKNCHIVTCPEANLKLGSGLCNINRMHDYGLNVAVGTDGPSSNNDLDLLSDARTAGMLNKALNNDASLSPAFDILEMLTLNGAKALGMADKIGSLEIGKKADFIAWDTNQLNSYPRHDPATQIVFAGNVRNIQDIWVGGKKLVKNGKLINYSLSELIDIAKYWELQTKNFH